MIKATGMCSRIIIICLFFIQLTASYAQEKCSALKEEYTLNINISPLNQGEVYRIKNEVGQVLDMVSPLLEEAVLNIKEIKKELNKTTICLNSSPQPLIGSQIRKGSVYFSKEQVVVVNLKEITERNDGLGVALLIIHELLGAQGIDDQNYQVTTLIYSSLHQESFGRKNVQKIIEATARHLSTAPRLIENIQFGVSGGVSGVGGGGDQEVAILKSLVVNYFVINRDYFSRLHNYKFDDDLVLDYVLNYRIESISEIEFSKLGKPTYPYMHYKALNGKMSIVIEENVWKELVNEQSKKFSQRTDFIQNLTNLVLLNYRLPK